MDEALLPRHAEDRERIDRLRELSAEELEPLAPSLLEWLKDEASPIASEIAGLLLPLEDELLPHLRILLSPSGDPHRKRAALRLLVGEWPADIGMELVPELIRIAMQATDAERDAEVDELAESLLERWL